MKRISLVSLAKILALLLAGLLLISFIVIGLIWFLRNSSSNLVSAGQVNYESISIYTARYMEAGYVIIDNPACNRRTDFSQIQHFQLTRDSGWWASLPLSTDDQGRYFACASRLVGRKLTISPSDRLIQHRRF